VGRLGRLVGLRLRQGLGIGRLLGGGRTGRRFRRRRLGIGGGLGVGFRLGIRRSLGVGLGLRVRRRLGVGFRLRLGIRRGLGVRLRLGIRLGLRRSVGGGLVGGVLQFLEVGALLLDARHVGRRQRHHRRGIGRVGIVGGQLRRRRRGGRRRRCRSRRRR